MLCQHCQKRIANVHFTQVINNDKVEMFLCDKCAKEKGQLSFGSPLNINDFFSGIVGLSPESFLNPVVQKYTCEKCGISYEDFQKSGKLGCENCYRVFGDRLQAVLKRLHGDVEHRGKMPSKVALSINNSKEIDKLREALNTAIQNEQYEKAAEIRDKIRSLEVEK